MNGDGLLTVTEVVAVTGYSKTSVYDACQRYRVRLEQEKAEGKTVNVVAADDEIPNVKGLSGIRIVVKNWPTWEIFQ